MKISKKQGLKAFAGMTVLATAITLAACNNDDNKSSGGPSQEESGYVSETSYSADAIPEEASKVDVMSYNMPYSNGEIHPSSAMVIYPKTEKPSDGWRVVVWTHGTTGVGDRCAPSKMAMNENFLVTANNLLERGYVIVAPDYEGLGDQGIHPYLNLESEANSAIYAVNAFKEKYGADLQGDWMSIGQSQGGHASLGVAQFANDDENYKGAVATAPASSLGYIITEVAPQAISGIEMQNKNYAIRVYSELLSYAAYVGVGIKAYMPSFNYNEIFHSQAYNVALSAQGTNGDNGLCLDDMIANYYTDIQTYLVQNPSAKVIDYPALTDDFLENETIAEFLASSQPGTVKLDKPIYVVQGTLDAAVPYQVTQALVNGMNQLGTTPQVQLDLVEGAGHTQAIIQRNEQIMDFIEATMPAS
ncbi:alpha/beta hydrolase [Acinetobacter sp. A3.8]|uniref:Alpha/beta hydrolase n=1 Tax=Acinetobacter sedimenti TaxID=2919922 RepID=A0A9X2B8A5_9GAMM|nr:alpha/beta hydrolase [Acinetobacter sedimenti]MCJ8145914.1 alpha/beta hydrolase [Acinetobacter sedimenti]